MYFGPIGYPSVNSEEMTQEPLEVSKVESVAGILVKSVLDRSTMLSVIIPTINEPLIGTLVERVHAELVFLDHEVVVVDKSNQPLSLTSARVIRQGSTGLGRAILEGVAAARGEIVAVMDADFSHRPEDLPLMVKQFRFHDFVLGSRYAKGGKNLDKPHRRIISRVFNRLAQLALQLDFRDPMSGFIIIRKIVFQKTQPNPIGFKINLEVVYHATRLGFKGAEVPITFRPRSQGKSKAGLHEAIRTAAYILALRFRGE